MVQDDDPFISVPWKDRIRIPVWRGVPWTRHCEVYGQNAMECLNELAPDIYDQLLRHSPRLKLVAMSKDHPSLLDARLTGTGQQYPNLWAKNATNGLYKLLPFGRINTLDYHSRYQVTLVLMGNGAAFRLTSHLRAASAVILQNCKYEEWFTRFMEPWRHYIPVSEGMNELPDILRWISSHEHEVQQIAQNGHQFYHDHLSKEQNEEHLYQLLTRMAEMVEHKQKREALPRVPRSLVPHKILLCDGKSFINGVADWHQSAGQPSNGKPAFTKSDVGKTVSIKGDAVEIGGYPRYIAWSDAKHHDVFGKIKSVEEMFKGKVQLGDGQELENGGQCLTRTPRRCWDTVPGSFGVVYDGKIGGNWSNWVNGIKMSCADYAKQGICKNGGLVSKARLGCQDTHQWSNGMGLSCGRYEALKYCRNGTVLEKWATGLTYNFPEQNCCSCGKTSLRRSGLGSEFNFPERHCCICGGGAQS